MHYKNVRQKQKQNIHRTKLSGQALVGIAPHKHRQDAFYQKMLNACTGLWKDILPSGGSATPSHTAQGLPHFSPLARSNPSSCGKLPRVPPIAFHLDATHVSMNYPWPRLYGQMNATAAVAVANAIHHLLYAVTLSIHCYNPIGRHDWAPWIFLIPIWQQAMVANSLHLDAITMLALNGGKESQSFGTHIFAANVDIELLWSCANEEGQLSTIEEQELKLTANICIAIA